MKFTIDKEELLRVLRFSEKIVESKIINNPILSCINLIISKNQCKCICNNGIISGSYELDSSKIEIEETGKILIKNKILLDIVSKLKEDKIQFHKVDNSVLKIKTESFSSEINILNDNEAPNINFNYENLPFITIKSDDLNEIFKKNSNCTFNDFNQIKTISGIYFTTKINPGYLTTLSTDTFRLAYLNIPNKTDINNSFILNNSTLNVINQIFKIANQDISFYIDEVNKKVFIHNNNITIIDRSILGEYPVDIFVKAFNIQKTTTIKINKEEFINSLELSRVMVNLEKNPIITLNISNNQLELNSSSFEIGTSKKIVTTSEVSGNEIKINFNISFLLSLLKNIDSKDVNLYIDQNDKPMLIVGDDENFKELILPVRVNN